MLTIRLANVNDEDGIWTIFQEVISTGDTYAFDPKMSKQDGLDYWCRTPTTLTYVAVDDGKILGTYILRPNQLALGAHVANAAFMVPGAARGHRVGHQMIQHMMAEARRLKYRAIQFNYVISTNIAAIKLWEKYGFKIVGTLPGAFRHVQLEAFVDVHVMYRQLTN